MGALAHDVRRPRGPPARAPRPPSRRAALRPRARHPPLQHTERAPRRRRRNFGCAQARRRAHAAPTVATASALGRAAVACAWSTEQIRRDSGAHSRTHAAEGRRVGSCNSEGTSTFARVAATAATSHARNGAQRRSTRSSKTGGVREGHGHRAVRMPTQALGNGRGAAACVLLAQGPQFPEKNPERPDVSRGRHDVLWERECPQRHVARGATSDAQGIRPRDVRTRRQRLRGNGTPSRGCSARLHALHRRCVQAQQERASRACTSPERRRHRSKCLHAVMLSARRRCKELHELVRRLARRKMRQRAHGTCWSGARGWKSTLAAVRSP